MGRKKINKILGYALVTSMLVGVGADTVYAATNINIGTAIVRSEGLRDGIYEANNVTSYVEEGNSTGENMARNAVGEKTKFRIEDGKTLMTVYFNSSLYGFMNNIEVSAGGEALKIEENKDDKSITFEVPSPDTKVKIGLFITMMGRKVELFLVNDMNTVNLLDEAPTINNAKDISVTQGDAIDLLSGVIGTDKEDSNLKVEISGDTSFIKDGKAEIPGVYPITYKVTDSSGQFDEKTVNVTVNKKTTLGDGSYTLKNTVQYVGQGNMETGNSMARKVLSEDSRIDISNGKNTVTLTFNSELYAFLKNFNVTVDGEKVEAEVNKDNRTIKFNIPDLNSDIVVSTLVSMMGKEVSFKTTLNYDTAKKLEDNLEDNNKPGNEDNENSGNQDNSGNTNSGSNGSANEDKENESEGSSGEIVDANQLKNGIYNIKNDVSYIGDGNQDVGNDMARKALSKNSKLEVKDDKKILTLKFNEEQFSFFKDFRITVNGKDVVATPNEADRTISFEIPSLDADIVVTAFVSVMGRDVSFKTILNKGTLELVSGEDKPAIEEENKSEESNGTSSSNNGSSANEGNSTVTENKVTKGKLYTIENKVVHKSQTGVDMARKYLNKISDLEEIDGKTYLTLTFTGQEFMKDHKISVNGKDANYKVVSKNGDSIKLRFEIPNLDADIKVSLYVIPMGRNVEFNVELLKDTKKFVKDFTLSSLPQTGLPIGGNSVALLGMAMMGASMFIRKREE
ncbi:NEAT domain-containing protein [Clostridium perfringens]|uniref:LPXTG cell wall anchor domain-containing protein n=1 Tax=Clostridium perfringens TaxID=1502 RepID=A0AAW9HT25_CLOPF|nr:NEAT domain-containing protein [Clostridium perfringens]MDZ4908812.1 LPXTG cell wall anchor domain-containing protein [Clostridium perfringens]MDZ4990023.1 LPXTG cell wall anchor domain-containing protein [Clostridium perfringens]MDZ5030269.1 LPXTG cell wall anchor domain-containing protein [Clostridium perfringens]MDZ5053456.1 LPXTG cell wall anchor domain-containing protein [Clostridium perfringens]MDZ5065358.1 LPXTG cell wall anchor domain-containing protein [Clostridium perfringens]